MKNLKKIQNLTNNPITLLLGLNHWYLKRVFTTVFRCFMTFWGIVIGFLLFESFLAGLVLLGIIWGIFFVIDKNRIESHLKKYNSKFFKAIELIRNKDFFKGFKKLVVLGELKESVHYIIENEPEILKSSILENVSKEQFENITNLIEKRDVDGVIRLLKKATLKF